MLKTPSQDGVFCFFKMHTLTNRNATRRMVYKRQDVRPKEDNMLNEFLFVAVFFLTRIVLPVVLTLVVGELIARRAHADAAES